MSVRAGAGSWGLTPAWNGDPVLAAAVPHQGDGSAGAGGDPTYLEAGGGEAGVGDGAVALLSPDAVVVLLVGEVEALLVVVGVQCAGGSCEVLKTPGSRFPWSGAGDLHDLDTPGVFHGVVPGDGELVALVPGLQDHVVPGVGPADHRRVGPLALCREPGLDTAPSAGGVPVPGVRRGGGGQHEIVEIEPEMRYWTLETSSTDLSWQISEEALQTVREQGEEEVGVLVK